MSSNSHSERLQDGRLDLTAFHWWSESESGQGKTLRTALIRVSALEKPSRFRSRVLRHSPKDVSLTEYEMAVVIGAAHRRLHEQQAEGRPSFDGPYTLRTAREAILNAAKDVSAKMRATADEDTKRSLLLGYIEDAKKTVASTDEDSQIVWSNLSMSSPDACRSQDGGIAELNVQRITIAFPYQSGHLKRIGAEFLGGHSTANEPTVDDQGDVWQLREGQ